MSAQASSWAFRQKDLKSGQKLLLVVLANYADTSGIAWPSRKTLAGDCCCGLDTITANMRALESAGLVARFERRRKSGSRTSDWIVLAPRSADRGPMVDGDPEALPPTLVEVATADRSGGEIQPEPAESGRKNGSGQVGNFGGPELPVELSVERAKALSTSAKQSGGGKLDPAVLGIFDAYVVARCEHKPSTSPARFKFTAAKRKTIEAARAFTDERTGERAFSDEELVDAVRGWLHFPHNCGENGKPYNELELILGRKGENIQRFADAEREHRERRRRTTGGGDDLDTRTRGQLQ